MYTNGKHTEFDSLWENQSAWWAEQMTILVLSDQIKESDALYQEYVVNGIDPNDSLFFHAPRMIDYFNLED